MTTIPADYVRSVLGPREPVLDELLRDSLLGHGLTPMQVDDNAARVLQLLTLVHRPRRVVEIGTYFGYSSIHIARGLPPGGRLTTLEVDAGVAELARRNLNRSGVADRVDVVVGDALEYLAALEPESIGMFFIDADKKSYPDYLKLAFPALETGGLLIADDAFLTGDFGREDGATPDGGRELRAINTYNHAAARSPRLFSAFIGTANGMFVSYKQR